MSDTFGEVLSEFKSSESAENIYPLVNDTKLCDALIAWKSVTVEYLSQAECEEVEDQKRWSWLWSRVKFDMNGWGIVAGCKAQDVQRLFVRLQGLRLIYPDGTINTYARQYLGQLIVAKVSGKRRPLQKSNGDR